MSILKFVDATGASEITGGPFDGVCFYIGGDAFRVWPKSEIDGRPERYRLPIWVRDNPGAVSASADAQHCLTALHAFGVPAGTLVALDSEMTVDVPWTRVFVQAVNAGGYQVIDYGSQSFVMGNDNPDGYYWGADWTDAAHLHSGDQMTQYVSFQNEDVSEASSALPFWDTRGPAPGPPSPSPVPAWQETMMNALPVLSEGAADRAGAVDLVGRVQALCAWLATVRHLPAAAGLPADGSFGPRTAAAVKAVQSSFGIAADGVVGPDTWGVLYTGGA